MREAALKIAATGTPVFPCKADKSPNTPHGFEDATTDPKKIKALFNKCGSALIGVPTGRRSGWFVVDEDIPGAAKELFDQLKIEMPRTRRVKTTRGQHFVFKHVRGVTNSDTGLPEKVDVRGEGGYVIVPPSPGYTVVDDVVPLQPPKELVELLLQPKALATKTASTAKLRVVTSEAGGAPSFDGPIPEGGRNKTLARIAGRLHDGRPLEDLEATLLQINAEHCNPPLPEGEVLKVARSIHRYEPCTPKDLGAEDSEIQEDLRRFETAMLEHFWGRWKNGLSITKVLLSYARKYGRRLPNGGIAFNLSYAELALEAATSKKAVFLYARRIKGTGLVAQDNASRGVKESSTWVLSPPHYTPARKV